MKQKLSSTKGFSIVELLVIVVILAVVGLLGWTAYNSMMKKDQKATNTDNSAKSEQPSEWKTYTNKELGITMQVPTTIAVNDAKCTEVTIEGKKYYTRDPGTSLTTVLQDGSQLYIAPTYQYQLSGKEAPTPFENRPTYEKCEHKTVTIEDVKQEDSPNILIEKLPITITKAANEASVRAYVKEKYEPLMPIESIKEDTSGKWQNVMLGCTGSGCGGRDIRFYPDKQLLIDIELGQSAKLISPFDPNVIYDLDIAKSVKPL